MSSLDLPFFPADPFAEDRSTILELLREVATDPAQTFILGARARRLEERVAAATGAAHVIACSSGTGALALCVDALELGPGDEVIVPAYCCQPVASTVVDAGARPVFVDIDPRTLVLDPVEVEAAVTPATRAIMPAHVFSIMADMPEIRGIADRHGVPVIEDAAVAQGAVLDGRPSGTWGDLGVFSFFQAKALGAIGEGGVVLTDDDRLAERCRMLRNHGQDGRTKGVHHLIGHNNRMDELLAAFLLHRYDRLDERLDRRAAIAAYYTERFESLRACGLTPPPPGRNGRCYYVYSVLSDDRDRLRAQLASEGIGTHVYYPLPLPAQPAFSAFAGDRGYPRSQAAGRRNLALPIYPELRDADVERIADAVCAAVVRQQSRAA